MSDWQQQPQPGWQQQSQQWQASGSAQPQQQQSWGTQPQQWPVPPQHQQPQQPWAAPVAPVQQQASAWGGQPATAQSATWGAPPQQQAQTQPSWNWSQQQYPAFNDPILNAGASIMQEQVKQAAALYTPGVSGVWTTLKSYFYVNNSFVMNKLSTLLFPFLKKDWNRTEENKPPALDPNSPDLYIPVMALSTYVLAVGLAKGSSMKFDPEVIVDVFGSSVMVQVVQVLIMRVALWAVGPWVPPVSWFDLFAFSGYQYVGVALNMLVGLLFGRSFYLLCLLWTASCAGFVMFRTMQAVVPPPKPGQRGKRRRVYFIVTCAVLQIVFMWFLGFTRELGSSGVLSFASSTVKGSPSIIDDVLIDKPQKMASPEAGQFDSVLSSSSNQKEPIVEKATPVVEKVASNFKPAKKGKKRSGNDASADV